MKILIVNDDGIRSEGIWHLAKLAQKLGQVTVVAPLHQCSGMSHKISFENDIIVRKTEIPVEGVDAYSVDGTPADCTRVGMELMANDKPDIVFSGINKGYNMGYETWFSGTVASALEATIYGIPAIAFSMANYDDYSVMDTYFEEIVGKLIEEPLTGNQIWNINIPKCSLEELKGIQYNCRVAKEVFYHDSFQLEQLSDRMFTMRALLRAKDFMDVDPDTDIAAVMNHCIAVGKVKGLEEK